MVGKWLWLQLVELANLQSPARVRIQFARWLKVVLILEPDDYGFELLPCIAIDDGCIVSSFVEGPFGVADSASGST